jgi:hypothetical protein
VAREIPKRNDLPILWALDFNVDPMCSIVAQRSGDHLFVLDEIVISRASTTDACQEFISRYPNHAAGLIIFGDASGNNLKTSGLTDYQMMRSFFAKTAYRNIDYRVPKSNPLVRDRVLLVNSRLRSAGGDVSLSVSARCSGLIADFEQVAYKPGSTLIDKDRDPKRTHLSDALGYLVWQELNGAARIGEQNRRLL